MKEANVPNVNTIPGDDVFCLDCRVLPTVKLTDVEAKIAAICDTVKQDFGVGSGSKGVPTRLEMIAELAEIVDLAVEDGQNLAGLIGHRLIAGHGAINDLQPLKPKRAVVILPEAVAVRASMPEDAGGELDPLRVVLLEATPPQHA